MKRQPRQEEPVYNKAERDEILKAMRSASERFYAMAVQTKCHPFIEFTGLMNEYIKVCQDASAKDIDFTQANTHTGQSLPIQTYHAAYLAEKLNCIYGPALLSSSEVRRTFIEVLLEGEFQLTRIKNPNGKDAAERAKLRPANFADLTPDEQWQIDKDLGILDWDGSGAG